jgi:nucleoside-diphosphate-sugar epimerase
MVDTVYRIAGQPRTLLRQVHPLLLRLAALSNRTVQEVLEMQYQFDEPFLVDSTKINIELGVRATPIEQALADTLASYSERQPGRPTRSVGGSRRLG